MDARSYQFPPEPRDYLTTNAVWIRNIPPLDSPYWEIVKIAAKAVDSDGCTGVPDWYIEACHEHDIHWRTGRTVFGVPITTRQANERFRYVIQARSKLGRLSPLSWWRWAGVTVSGLVLDHKSA